MYSSCVKNLLNATKRAFLQQTAAKASNTSMTASKLNFELNDESKAYRNLARKFAREVILPQAAQLDKTGEFPMQILQQAHKLGLMNNFVPKQYGGTGLSLVDDLLMVEETCYACSGISLAYGGSALATAPLLRYGNHELKKEFLGRLIAEPLLAAYCVTEPSTGSDVAAIKTTAVKNGDGDYVINGEKMWITNAGFSNWFFVLARSDLDPKARVSQAFTGFIVERESAGVSTGRKEDNMGQRACDTRGVTFEDVIVPAKNIVGKLGAGFAVAMGAFDFTRPRIACGAVGVAQRALDESTKYAFERQAFGEPIANFQAVQFKLAEMAMGIETCRLAYIKSAWLYDKGESNTYWASIAKALASDLANRSAQEAVQIFGGAGFNCGFPVEKLMRDAKIFQIYEGTSEIQRLLIAREHFAMVKKGAAN